MSKKVINIVDLLVWACMAIWGQRSPQACHCMEWIFVSGSNVCTELSSPVMMACKRSGSSASLSKFWAQTFIRKCLCSSVRTWGTHLGDFFSNRDHSWLSFALFLCWDQSLNSQFWRSCGDRRADFAGQLGQLGECGHFLVFHCEAGWSLVSVRHPPWISCAKLAPGFCSLSLLHKLAEVLAKKLLVSIQRQPGISSFQAVEDGLACQPLMTPEQKENTTGTQLIIQFCQQQPTSRTLPERNHRTLWPSQCWHVSVSSHTQGQTATWPKQASNMPSLTCLQGQGCRTIVRAEKGK